MKERNLNVEMKEYAYSEEEMRTILGGSRGPLSQSTLRKKIQLKTGVPPSIKIGPDYWFPRDGYADWLRAQRPSFQKKGSRAS